MEGQPKTSFIPKTPLQTQTSGPVISKSKKRKTVFSFIGVIVFLASIASIVGVYFYKFTLEKKIEAQVESLQTTKDEFDERFIQDATRLNSRITNSLSLLQNHISPSSIFSLLEEYTLQTVSFGNFSFEDNKDGQIKVYGSGESARFESIVLQSDSFGDSGFMRNVLFTDLEPDTERQTIRFSFSATLDPRLILYRNSLSDSSEDQIQDEVINTEQ